jgi:glycosyltransferase involved in cell wall biosynthesis
VAPDSRSPRFSVVIPTLDRATQVEHAVRSVLAQTDPDFEVIVVDDGSTDDTATRIAAITDPRVRYVAQERAGAGPARNQGAAVARGRYLTFLDSDDDVVPEWLERLVAAFVEQECALLSCGYVVRWPPDVAHVERPFPPRDLAPLFPGVEGNFVHAGSFALERQLLLAVGGYASTRALQHSELSYRLVPFAIEHGLGIGAIPDLLLVYYRGGTDAISDNAEAVLDGYCYVLAHHTALLRRDPELLANCQAIAGVRAARLGRAALARRLFRAAVRTRPLDPRGWARAGVALAPRAVQRRVWNRRSEE